jgi:hypothetical protein
VRPVETEILKYQLESGMVKRITAGPPGVAPIGPRPKTAEAQGHHHHAKGKGAGG